MKKTSIFLSLSLLAVATLSAKEAYSNIPTFNDAHRESKLTICSEDSGIMTLTEAQYNGTEPINLPLDKQLFIQATVSNLDSFNGYWVHINEDNPLISIVYRNYISGIFSKDNPKGMLTIAMTCTPQKTGQTTISVVYGELFSKTFTINVIDPVNLD